MIDIALQSFCNEEQDRIAIFRTLPYTRIRLHVLRKYLPQEKDSARNTQGRFLDIAIGYINTELDLLRRYNRTQEEPMQSEPAHRWTGTLVELIELIYGLQEVRCIDDGELQSMNWQFFRSDIQDGNQRAELLRCLSGYEALQERQPYLFPRQDARTSESA